MKTITWPLCLMAVAVAALAWLPSQSRAADDAVVPFIDLQTNGVIAADLSGLDLDQFSAWRKKMVDGAAGDQAAKDRANAQMDKSMESTRKWLGDFHAAGGKNLYVVISLNGLMTGQPGAAVVPLGPQANSDALAKVFLPNGNPPPADANDPGAAMRSALQPQTVLVGNSLIFTMAGMAKKLQTPSTEARPDLLAALAAGGDAPIRLALVPSSINQSPLVMLARQRGGQHLPFAEPEWNNVTWVLASFSPPPKESGQLICQCKDADSATALAAMLSQKMDAWKTDAQARQTLGQDMDKLIAAAKPQVNGNKVTISIDQKTMDDLVGPAMVKMMFAQGQPRPTVPNSNVPPLPPANGGL